MMKVKVCGMREAGNIKEVAASGIDYMGFIFYPKSPRYCGDALTPEDIATLPAGIVPVAVTVNASEEEIEDIARRLGISAFQLHGSESPESCARLREKGYKIFKAFGIREDEDFSRMLPYVDVTDLFIFDTSSARHGGTGRKFDWSLLKKYRLPQRFLLSGGIGREDAGEINNFLHPCFAGIDLNSKFETEPGLKDAGLLETFLQNLSHI
ncbi:MAG: phosphoribosylanthranilate isomerase [Muribaculaceae bacterium]|nr:phosphoribosylanthranilate isomerase [Muribaculaceae bacterium]